MASVLANFCFLALVAAAHTAPTIHESSRTLIHDLTRELSITELSESPRIHMNRGNPSHVTLRQGESMTLECNALGVPAPVIYWRKNGHRVRQAFGDHESNFFEKLTNLGATTVESSSTIGRLHLECAQPDTAGVYECVADNGFKKVVNRTVVNVVPRSNFDLTEYEEGAPECLTRRIIPDDESDPIPVAPRIFMHTEWRFEQSGNNVQMFCRASGVPRPKITWLNENLEHVKTGDRVSILSNGDLFIRNVQQMGQFFCVASNMAGVSRIDTFLYVTKPDEANDS